MRIKIFLALVLVAVAIAADYPIRQITSSCTGGSTCVLTSTSGSVSDSGDVDAVSFVVSASNTYPSVTAAFTALQASSNTGGGSSTGNIASVSVTMRINGFQAFEDSNGNGEVDDGELRGSLTSYIGNLEDITLDESNAAYTTLAFTSDDTVTENAFSMTCKLPKETIDLEGFSVSPFATVCSVTLSNLVYPDTCAETCTPALSVALIVADINMDWDTTTTPGSDGTNSFKLSSNSAEFDYSATATYGGTTTTVTATGTVDSSGNLQSWFAFPDAAGATEVTWSNQLSTDSLAQQYVQPKEEEEPSPAALAAPVALIVAAVVAAVSA